MAVAEGQSSQQKSLDLSNLKSDHDSGAESDSVDKARSDNYSEPLHSEDEASDDSLPEDGPVSQGDVAEPGDSGDFSPTSAINQRGTSAF